MTLADSSRSLESQVITWDEAIDGATITLNGTNYQVALTPSAITYEMTEQGWKQVQTISIAIRKTLLVTRPAKDTALTWNGNDFFVTATSGDAPHELTWTIRARRVI